MKFKDLKRKIKNEKIVTPEILENVKEEYVSNNDKNIRIKNPVFIKAMVPVFILLISLVFVIVSVSGKTTSSFYSSSGFKTFSNEREFKNVLNYEKKTFHLVGAFSGTFLKKSSSVGTAINEGATTEGTGEVSKTNTQFENVDEDDVIKFDDKRIYRLNGNYLLYNDLNDFENTKSIVLENIEGTNKTLHPHMYLTRNYVICYYSNPNKAGNSKMVFFDKESLNIVKTYETDGYIVDTRIIKSGENETLIALTQKYVYGNGELTPNISIDGNVNNVSYKDIFYTEDSCHLGYTVVTSAFLDSSIDFNSITVLGPSSYTNCMINENSIYLTSPQTLRTVEENVMSKFDYSKTNEVVLRFTIEDDKVLPYGSLITTGNIIDRFSIDEKDGYLRLALSEINNNHIEIYKIEDNKFSYVSGIRDGLGEKNEVIKSARFNEDTLLVVTAKNTDPLYKIDLKDPLNPKIIGKFKEDGFNTILQYLKGDLIGYAFALGYQTEDKSDYYNVRIGTKLDLYNIKGENPVEIDEINYNATYFEAAEDIRAIFQYENYIGFEVNGTYYLYEIVKNEDEYFLNQVLSIKIEMEPIVEYDWLFDNGLMGLLNARMCYVNGYFYMSYVPSSTLINSNLLVTGIYKYDSSFNLVSKSK